MNEKNHLINFRIFFPEPFHFNLAKVKNLKSLLLILMILLMLFLSINVQAGIDIYQFESGEDEKRFRSLIAELRCPKCQNQNLADSNAGLAKDLKDRTYQLVREGRSNEEIKDYLVERYGDFIIYQLPFRKSTLLLWLGPLLVFLVVMCIVILRRLKMSRPEKKVISEFERKKLKAILEDRNQDDD